MGFPIRIDLSQQFLLIPLGRHRHFLLDLLVQIRAGLDVRPVYEHRRRGQRPRAARLLQYPVKHRLYRFLGETVPEVVAHRREVG